jgi:hypothetical protein
LTRPKTRKFINECRENALGAKEDRILPIREAIQVEAVIPKKGAAEAVMLYVNVKIILKTYRTKGKLLLQLL